MEIRVHKRTHCHWYHLLVLGPDWTNISIVLATSIYQYRWGADSITNERSRNSELALWLSGYSQCLWCQHPVWIMIWTPAALPPCSLLMGLGIRIAPDLGPCHPCGRSGGNSGQFTSPEVSPSHCSHLGCEPAGGRHCSPPSAPTPLSISAFQVNKTTLKKLEVQMDWMPTFILSDVS